MFTLTQLQERFTSEKSNRDTRLTARNRTRFTIHLLHGVARVLLLISLCLAPWCLGGVEPESQVFLYATVLSSLLVWCAATAFTQSTLGLAPIRLPPLILPLLGVLVLGAYQLQLTSGKLDPDLAKSNTIAAVSEVAAMDSSAWSTESTPGTDPVLTPTGAPSIDSSSLLKKLLPQDYPWQTIAVGLTRYEAARYSIAIVAFFLGVVLFQSHLSQVWLCGTLAANGAALSVFGVLQNVTWNGRLYWIIPLTFGGEPFASFVNRKNAAGYLSLTLAAALGLMYWAYCRREWFDGAQKIIDDSLKNGSRRFHRRVSRNLRKIIATLDRFQIAATFVATLILMGIIGSRSGLLATTIAGMTCLFLLCRLRGELRSLSAVAIELGLFTIGLVVWIGVVGNAAESWVRSDWRSEVQANWHDALKVVDDFPATGAGFGTYAYAYLPYQVRPATVWFTHADNQFVEILVEGGVVGIGLVVVLILTSLGSTLALGRNKNRPAEDPAGLVGTFAVISQAISACFDYGTTLPATMLTLAVIMGAVTGRGARLADSEDPKTWWLACPGLRPAWMILLLGTAFWINGVFAWREVLVAAQVKSAYRGLPQRLDAPESLPFDDVNHVIGRLTTATAFRPDDAEAHRALGNLWIYRYRLAALVALRHSDRNEPEAWSRTDVSALYVLANELDSSGQHQRLDELRESSLVAENLLPARHHFEMAHRVSPLLPGVDLPLAMLAFLDPSAHANGVGHLERAVVLTPTDPETLDAVATLAEAVRMPELAYGCWRRELLSKPDALRRIATHLVGRIGIEEQLACVIPNSPQVYMELATTVYAGSGADETRHFLLTKVVQVLTEQSETMLADSEGLHLMARARWLLDESESAIDYYRRALAQEPMQLDWRLELVDLLRSQRRFALALKQAELCLSIDPHRLQTQVIIKELRAELATENTARKSDR